MTNPRLIEIIGGGLSGLSLGLALRREGVPVTLVEAGAYPRHRVCGEFITGLDDDTLARLGLADALRDARQHREVGWFLRNDPTAVQRLPRPALGISRHALDARLAAAFVAAGGELHVHTRAPQLAPAAGRVLATGRRRGSGEWLGLKVHVRGLALHQDLEVHLGADAYVGLATVEDGAVNVCGLFRRRRLPPASPRCRSGFTPRPENFTPRPDVLVAYLAACGLTDLCARLQSAVIDPSSACAVAALPFDAAAHGGGGARDQADLRAADLMRIGDNAAMIPPFTGNGMAMAFQSAVAALDPLLRYARGAVSWPEACHLAAAAQHRRFAVRLRTASALHGYLLRPRRQRLLAFLHRARLVPFRPLYALLH